uniref:BTB domain-containing protein n=1 Tax=Acrobeloides nanus TaxID=290746 RepID=A0A914D933_9BILA
MAALKKTFQAGDYVKLNVGGHLFQTSVSTLTKYDSMLKHMLAHELTVDNDGFILIDRNGTYFEYILDFMRDALVFPTHDVHKILCILGEAEYFQLQLLVDRCTEILEKEKLDPLPDDRLPFL